MLSLRAERSNLDRVAQLGPRLLRRVAPRNDAALKGHGRPICPIALPRLLQCFGYLKGELESLGRIEPWVAVGEIALGKGGLVDLLGAADTFGDILPGQFEMNATGVTPLAGMDRKGAVQFSKDAVERTGFVAVRGSDCVAVHRIAAPHDLSPFALDGAYQVGQPRLDLVRAHPRDQSETSRLVLRVEAIDQTHEIIRFEGRSTFHADGVLDPAQKLGMSAVDLAGAVAEPSEMSRAIVPIASRGIDTGQGFLVGQEECLVRCVELGLAD